MNTRPCRALVLTAIVGSLVQQKKNTMDRYTDIANTSDTDGSSEQKSAELCEQAGKTRGNEESKKRSV